MSNQHSPHEQAHGLAQFDDNSDETFRLSREISSTMNVSSPIPIGRKSDYKYTKNCTVAPMSLTPSFGSASSWRSSPMLTPSRPTKDEASALWEIMSTPSPPNNTSSQYRSTISSNISHPLATPIISPNFSPLNNNDASSTPTLFPFPKIKNGPPYESTLPRQTASPRQIQSLSLQNAKKNPLLPRSIHKQKNPPSTNNVSSKKCLHHGLGPFLEILPESIIYSIISYIKYVDRHPTLLLISHGMTLLVTRPELLLEMKHSHAPKDYNSPTHQKGLLSQVLGDDLSSYALNEILIVVGGKYPTKGGSINNNHGGVEEIPFGTETRAIEGRRIHRRMSMENNEQHGIMGYDPRENKWVRFGGDPLEPLNYGQECDKRTSITGQTIPRRPNTLHPLSPLGFVDAQPLYLGHPHYCLVLFGGTHHETGLPSNRVVAYSFLTAKWELWPEMMRPRHGDDFVLARVDGDGNSSCIPTGTLHPCNDSIILIGCDLEFCDCFRCNPTSSPTNHKNTDIEFDVISFDDAECNLSVAENARKTKENHDAIGRCEVFDLTARKWERRRSRAPSCPPDDSGAAVLGGRYVYLPGTCPPPPNSWQQMRESFNDDEGEAEIVTPLSQSEANSQTGPTQSQSSSIVDNREMDVGNDQSSLASMDIEDNNSRADEITPSPLSDLFRSLHYRPGLMYDAWFDKWSTLPARPYVTTSSPTTYTFHNHILVLGGYRSSSENALSCYHHREEDSILDYEDHLDYAWWYSPFRTSTQHTGYCESDEMDPDNRDHYLNEPSQDIGEWTFGGGTSMFGHRQSWSDSGDMAAAVAAATALQQTSVGQHESIGSPSQYVNAMNQFPCGAPMAVRGACLTTYQGRLTMLGGLSTFSRTFYDSERKTIWQFFPENREWRRYVKFMQGVVEQVCLWYCYYYASQKSIFYNDGHSFVTPHVLS